MAVDPDEFPSLKAAGCFVERGGADQPRDEKGRWTGEGAAGAPAWGHIHPTAPHPSKDEVLAQAKKLGVQSTVVQQDDFGDGKGVQHVYHEGVRKVRGGLRHTDHYLTPTHVVTVSNQDTDKTVVSAYPRRKKA